WFAVEIGVEPGPGRREHEDEKNRAQRKDNERHRYHPRTFVRGDVLRCCRSFRGVELRWAHRLEVRVPSRTKKNVDYLPSHVQGGESHSGQHQVMWQGGDGPMCRAVQDFFLCPAARKEEGNAAQIHHADGVSEERYRHDPAQAAHFADVLFMIKSMNDGASTEKEQRFEKPMRDQMHDPSRDTTDTERDHHQAKLRDG